MVTCFDVVVSTTPDPTISWYETDSLQRWLSLILHLPNEHQMWSQIPLPALGIVTCWTNRMWWR